MTEIALGGALLDPSSRMDRLESIANTAKLAGRSSLYHLSGKAFMDRHWQTFPTSFQPVESGSSRPSSEYWLAMPGFGSGCGERAARMLRHILPAEVGVSGMVISPDGTNPPEVRDLVQTHLQEQQAQSVSGYLHSMSLLRFLWSVQDLDVHVDRMILDGSPSSLDAVRLGDKIKRLGPILQKTGYRGGVIGKGFISLAREIDRNGFHDIRQRVAAAYKDTVTGSSPHRGFAEIVEFFLYNQANMIHHPERFPGIDADTDIIVLHAADLDKDRSVNMKTTIDEVSDFAEAKQARLTILPVPNSGHAETAKSLATAKQTIKDSYARVA